MTKASAERATGLRIVQSGLEFFGFDGDRQVVHAVGLTEREAVSRLVQANWVRVSRLIFERDGWKCRMCGSSATLTVHHLKYRSHGRDDRPENLVALDAKCHKEVHETKRKVPLIPWPS